MNRLKKEYDLGKKFANKEIKKEFILRVCVTILFGVMVFLVGVLK